MLLFKKYTMNIPCSRERFLQTLERKVYPCSMVRSIFPLYGVYSLLVGMVHSGSVKLRYREEWFDGIRIPRAMSPILRGTVIKTGDDCCALVYRFFPDSLLFPFIILCLAGILRMIFQDKGYTYLLLPLLPLFPFFIMTGFYSVSSAQTEKKLNEVIEIACDAGKC